MHKLNLTYPELRLVLQTIGHRRMQTDNPELKGRLEALEEKISQQAMSTVER